MIWNLILAIKHSIERFENDFNLITVKVTDEILITFDDVIDHPTFIIDFSNSKLEYTTCFNSSNPFLLETKSNHFFNARDIELLELYLPYALLPYYAKKNKKCYAISHFAQTLDGRIASFSGDSKWIGNEENLIHAHRMRALCDAIMIGSKTLDADNPRLNVRLVKGTDPIKVIIGGDNLSMDEYGAIDDSTIMFCQNHLDMDHNFEKVLLEKNIVYNADHILKALVERGIYSVYIEGGSFTTSTFLKQNALDQVQLHISPKILGSGTNSFSFEGIFSMEQAIKFTDPKFISIGREVMFLGNLD
ncbi:MAG: RibD family protein [Bacteroidota bacterium]